MDISPSYNWLLGRTWIHMAGVVPSTFHQKVKFVVKENLITIAAEANMIATTTTSTPYLEVKEDATECAFRSFMIVTATSMKDELEILASLIQKYLDGCKSTYKKRSQSWMRSEKEPSKGESSNFCGSQELSLWDRIPVP